MWRRRGERKATGRPGAFPGPPPVDRGGDDPAAVLVGMALQLLATGAPDAARQWLDRAAAEARDPALLRAIGVIYWQHLNAERKAEACLRRAAAAGSIDAMSDLGVLLRRHNKIHEAERWLVRAASSGDASALNNLGNLFEQRGDLPGAIEAWSRAANQGSLMAMATLGLVLSAHGNVAEARQWRDRAAEVLRQGGHPEASNQEILGKLLLVDTMLAGEPAPKRDPPSRAANPNAPVRVDMTDPLATIGSLLTAYRANPDPQTLDLALNLIDHAVDAYPDGNAGHAEAVRMRGVLLREDFERSGDSAQLTAAIEDGRAAVASAQDDAMRAGAWSSLSVTLMTRYESTPDPAVLDEAIVALDQARRLMRADNPERAGVVSTLGGALLQKSGLTDDAGLLDEAVMHLEAALRATPATDPALFERQFNLAMAKLRHGQLTGNAASVSDALELLRRAHDGSPADHRVRAVAAQLLASADRADEDSPALTDDPPEDLDLAVALHTEFERSGYLPHLHRSIDILRTHLEGRRLRGLPRQQTLHTLATALWSLYERTGGLAALDEAVELFQAAIEEEGGDSAQRLASRANRAAVLMLRARHTASLDDLHAAIAEFRLVLDETPPDHPMRPNRVGGLAGALAELGQRTMDSALFNESAAMRREALAALPAGHGSAPDLHSGLAVVLLYLAPGAADSAQLLDEAVDHGRRAVAGTAPDSPNLPRFQANLALALLMRYKSRRHEDDLETGLGLARAAIAGTPQGHANRAERLTTLRELLVLYNQRSPEPAHFDELVDVTEAALTATPAGHPQHDAAVVGAATALMERGIFGGDAASLYSAMIRLEALATDEAALVAPRLDAAFYHALGAQHLGDAPTVRRSAALVGELLPRLAPRALARADRETQLSRYVGRASAIAACALNAGDPELAVALLEQGRGVLLAEAIDARGDLTDLRASHPGLAVEFERLRDSAQVADPAVPPVQALRQRQADSEAWLDLLRRIRQVPGFEHFAQPPDVATLRAACKGGPVVVVNVSDLRCDALVLTEQQLRVIPLPGLIAGEVDERARTFLEATYAPRPAWFAANQIAAETLGWLWDTVAEPVLTALGLTGPAGDDADWPRVWWVPTGQLAFLPLHAAGSRPGSGGAPGSVLDRVVSSYLPMVRSRYASRGVPPLDGRPSALVVSMPGTPGFADLPGAAGEAASLKALLDVEELTGGAATRAAVLAALPAHRWAHFACHAQADVSTGANGRVLLYDHEAAPLTVREISRLRPATAELAYLSACRTSVGPRRLADELVHLTGAFHMAGYRHVVGTLWQVYDDVAGHIADAVYTRITARERSVDDIAVALHHAVRHVRATNQDSPLLWAAYLHVGP